MGPSWSLAAITPCYPTPPSKAWGHNCLEEEEEKEKEEEEEKKEEKQEKEGKSANTPPSQAWGHNCLKHWLITI